MRPTTRVRASVAAVGLAATLLVAPTAAAQDPVADCLAENKIYLYVFDQGEPVVEGCTEGKTGMARLTELAEVKTSGSFICQVNGHPEICETPLGDLPYWSYWWWRDSAWRYATIGGSYPGEPGSVEAWHFSSGVEPPITPPVTGPASPSASTSAPAGTTSEQTTQASPETPPPAPTGDGQITGSQLWLPTAITAAVLALAGIGYALTRRNRR